MTSSKLSLALFALLLSVILSNGLPQGKSASKSTKRHFSLRERALLQTISSQKPNIFRGRLNIETILNSLTELEPSPQDYPKHLYIDEYFVEYRQLLTQAIKIPKDANLPELDWREHYDFCIWFICFDFTLSQRSEDSKLIGAQSITSKTDITSTTFKNTFTVPYFKWSSPSWHFKIEDHSYDDVYHMFGYHITATNFTLEIEADYEYVENLGIHLSNFSIGFNVGNLTTRLDDSWLEYGNGDMERYGPYEADLTDSSMREWRSVGKDYTKIMHLHLNCIFTNGKADQLTCPPSTDENYYQYNNFLLMQLIQTIGLGSLLE